MLEVRRLPAPPSVRRLRRSGWLLTALRALLYTLVLVASSALLASGLAPWLSLVFSIAVLGGLLTLCLFRWPVLAAYILVGAAIVIEQWPVREIEPFTSRIPLFQTIYGATGVNIPFAPIEVFLVIAVIAAVVPTLARYREGFYRGALFWPVVFFMSAVIVGVVWGLAAQSFDRPFTPAFNKNAAWVETRAFVYFTLCYIIASNVLTTRRRVTTLMWVLIAAVGFKGIQGIYSHSIRRRYDLDVQAITGHEDVIFFAFFLLFLTSLFIYSGPHRQRVVMLALAPFVTFTIFATTRRMAFFVLALAVLILAAAMWRTRRDLFMKIAPVVLVLLSLYTIAFWNRTETLAGQPVRAFRSQLGYTTERDELSDVWRDLENYNVAENIKSSPAMGLGFGRPYHFYVEQPSLDETGFVYWTYITHNAVFWVWMKMGLLGFFAFWLLIGSALVYAMIMFRRLPDDYLRAVALAIGGLVAMQVLFSYGDLGLTYSRPMIVLGIMLGVLARLPAIARDEEQSPSEREESTTVAVDSSQPAPGPAGA
jgi:hypothetical protein